MRRVNEDGAFFHQVRRGAVRTDWCAGNSVHPGYMPPKLNNASAAGRASKAATTPAWTRGGPVVTSDLVMADVP